MTLENRKSHESETQFPNTDPVFIFSRGETIEEINSKLGSYSGPILTNVPVDILAHHVRELSKLEYILGFHHSFGQYESEFRRYIIKMGFGSNVDVDLIERHHSSLTRAASEVLGHRIHIGLSFIEREPVSVFENISSFRQTDKQGLIISKVLFSD